MIIDGLLKMACWFGETVLLRINHRFAKWWLDNVWWKHRKRRTAAKADAAMDELQKVLDDWNP